MPNTSGEFPMPYPNSTDVPDVPGDILLLAEAVTEAMENGYRLVQTVEFTSTGPFTKATYPWLRAIRVRAVGGGGGGGGAATTGASQNAIATSGGGGSYAESFITDIAGLASSVTVTVGSGGAGGSAGANAGTAGGDSSFGSTVIAPGGAAGGSGPANSTPGFQAAPAASVGGTGDFTFGGQPSEHALYLVAGFVVRPNSGGSMFGAPERGAAGSGNGSAATVANEGYGVGGTGGANAQSQGSARSGGAGSPGIVRIDLFA